jgi:hypothetical protein
MYLRKAGSGMKLLQDSVGNYWNVESCSLEAELVAEEGISSLKSWEDF